MPREYRVYLDDILGATRKIEKYITGMDFAGFQVNELQQDAILRNLEIIGEAVKHLPDDIKDEYSDIEWKKIAGLRDILIHSYFGIDYKIIWDIVTEKIPVIKETVELILRET